MVIHKSICHEFQTLPESKVMHGLSWFNQRPMCLQIPCGDPISLTRAKYIAGVKGYTWSYRVNQRSLCLRTLYGYNFLL